MELEISPGRHFILVVDTASHRGRALAREFRDAGCYTALATTAAEALRYSLENEPDVVLSEWELPDMAGVELCRRIKSERWGTKVILHREVADLPSLRRTLESGGSDLLSGPMSADALLGHLGLQKEAPAAHARTEQTVLDRA